MSKPRRYGTTAALLTLLALTPTTAHAQQTQILDRTDTTVTIKYTGLTPGTNYTIELRQGTNSLNTTAFTTTTTPIPSTRWVPAKTDTFYWQLQGALAARYANYKVIDIDGFDTTANTVASIKSQGHRAVCYLSAGTWEDWRPDANQFPASALGNSNGWPGERWLDTRNATVRQIMTNRVAMCKNKGFDAVEFDNQDGYTNSTGFPLTATTQLDYNRFLATAAHNAGLAAVLKNDVEQVAALQPDYDAALNEQCAQYSECGPYKAFLDAGKPVWQVEYGTKNLTRCQAAITAGRRAYYAGVALSGSTRWDPC